MEEYNAVCNSFLPSFLPSLKDKFYPSQHAASFRAFTLSELLIALAILGLIATFTIPKILHQVESSSKKAIFKETIANLNEIVYSGQQQGSFATQTSWAYVRDHLDHLKACSGNSSLEGCYTGATATAYMAGMPGFLLKNGAGIYGLSPWGACNSATTPCEGELLIDWNGGNPPNDLTDQLTLKMCVGGDGKTNCNDGTRPGTVSSVFWGNQTLWREIFK